MSTPPPASAGTGGGFRSELLKQLETFRTLDKRRSFCHPVPKDKYPDYYEKIKNPICFDDIQRKIETGQYDEGHHLFQADLMLLFNNSCEYNPPGHKIRIEASRLLLRACRLIPPALEEAMINIMATLNAADEKATNDVQGPVFKTRVTEEIAPCYFTVVPRPICFDDVVRNIRYNVYCNLGALRHDLELVFLNCLVYNNPHTPYYARAQWFLADLDEVFARYGDSLQVPSTCLPIPVLPGTRRKRHELSVQQALRSILTKVRDADALEVLNRFPFEPSFKTLFQKVARPEGPIIKPGVAGGHPPNHRPPDLLTQVMVFADRLRTWADSRPDLLSQDSGQSVPFAHELGSYLLSMTLKLKVRLFERLEAAPLPNGKPHGPSLSGPGPGAYVPTAGRSSKGTKASNKRPREP